MVIGLWSAIIIGASILIGVGSRYLLKKADNPIEEIAEQVFESQTGIEVDFSPEEKKKK